MRSLVTMLPFEVAISGAPTISSSDVEPAFPPGPDLSAKEIWVIRNNATSLIGLNGNELTPRANALTYTANSGIEDANGRNGAYVPWPDAATGTMAWIAKRPDANSDQIIGGSQTNDTLGGGSTPSWSGGTCFVNTRGISQISIAPGMDVGDWYFLIVSHHADHRVALLGGGTPITTSGTKIPSTTGLQESVGNAWYPTASYVASGIEVAGAMVWDGGKTEEECVDLYLRTKLWFAELGVNIY